MPSRKAKGEWLAVICRISPPSLPKAVPPIGNARRLKMSLLGYTFIEGVRTRARILNVSSSGTKLHTGTSADRESENEPDPSYERTSAMTDRLRETGGP